MKNNKWLWLTLTTLLTLLVLIGVAGAGFRMGAMQSATLVKNADGTTSQFSPFERMHGFEDNFNDQHRGNPHMMQGFGHGMRGRGGFISPLFGLVKLAIFGALLWFGFRYVKNSGWKLTRTTAPVPTSSGEVEEKRDSE